MNQKEKEMTKISGILTLLFTVAFAAVLWLGSEKQAEQSNLKPCEHWVFNYHFRGRMNSAALCADSLYITDRGDYTSLPPHLEELQGDITKQYKFLIQRMSLINRGDLPKPED